MLHTKRLFLRGPRASDLDAMFAIYSDPQNMTYWSTPPHPDRDTTQKMLSEKIAAFALSPVNFLIELDGQMIGNAGVFREWEVGFMLHHPFHRQGLVSEAMLAILPYIWATTPAQTLTGDADPHNAASVALFQKLGFHETHRAKDTFCINGVWSDSVYFALDRPKA
ncbi:MAG: GNAT family N-acetyltransferase [Pseudomonadota bacterium]